MKHIDSRFRRHRPACFSVWRNGAAFRQMRLTLPAWIPGPFQQRLLQMWRNWRGCGGSGRSAGWPCRRRRSRVTQGHTGSRGVRRVRGSPAGRLALCNGKHAEASTASASAASTAGHTQTDFWTNLLSVLSLSLSVLATEWITDGPDLEI